jgi:zinc protease
MVVAGNVTIDEVKRLSEKWFGPIPAGEHRQRKLPQEPKQMSKRTGSVEANVPANALYKSWHMPGRDHHDFYAIDLASDILSRGHSSRLYQQLVKEKEIFTSISSFTTGTIDPGMFVASGRVKPGVSLEQAEEEMDKIMRQFIAEGPTKSELEKVKNQAEASNEFGNVEVMNRAMNLAYASLLGNPDLINTEMDLIRRVKQEDVMRVSKEIMQEDNSSVLYYKSATTK